MVQTTPDTVVVLINRPFQLFHFLSLQLSKEFVVEFAFLTSQRSITERKLQIFESY